MRIVAAMSPPCGHACFGQRLAILHGPLRGLLVIGEPVETDREVLGGRIGVRQLKMRQTEVQPVKRWRQPVRRRGRFLTGGPVDESPVKQSQQATPGSHTTQGAGGRLSSNSATHWFATVEVMLFISGGTPSYR